MKLVRFRAQVTDQDMNGWTPLHLATWQHGTRPVSSRELHVATQGVDGLTPLYCASGSPREDLEIEPFLAEDDADMTAERPNCSLERGHKGPAGSSSNAVPMRQPRMGRRLYRASER